MALIYDAKLRRARTEAPTQNGVKPTQDELSVIDLGIGIRLNKCDIYREEPELNPL